MRLFLLLGFSLLLHHEIEAVTTHSVTGCSNSVNLNCGIFEMIHVERITYYNGTDCNQAVTDLQVCGQPVTGSGTGLAPLCTGFISCSENLHYTCPGSKAARLDYRCVPGSNTKNMCNAIVIGNTNRIFLSTPNYPSPPSFTGISPCRCLISNITSIQILELALTSASDGTKSSLDINYGDIFYKTESFNNTTSRRVYNRIVSPSSTTSTTVEITLNHNSFNRQFLWIEVQGVNLRTNCNNYQNSPFTTPSSTEKLSSSSIIPTIVSSTTESVSTSPRRTTTSFQEVSSRRTTTSVQEVTSRNTTTSVPEVTSRRTITPFQKISPRRTTTFLPEVTRGNEHTTTSPNGFLKDLLISTDKDILFICLIATSFLCVLLVCVPVIVVCVLCRRGKIAWVKKSPQVQRERSPYSGLDLNQRVAGRDGGYQEINIRNSRSPEQGERNPYSGLELNQRVAGNDGTYLELSTRNLRSPEEEGERNPYSGLDQAQRVAGNDGTYQELNTRNSRPQYHNVSRSTHPEYHNLN